MKSVPNCSKSFAHKKKISNFFRNSIFISFEVSCHCYGNDCVLYCKIDRRWEPRQKLPLGTFTSLFLFNIQVLSAIRSDRSIINLKWLLPHQLIRLNLSSLAFNLMSISLTEIEFKLFETTCRKSNFAISDKINYTIVSKWRY